ncbi:MAG: ABC transporter permease [Myxococcota bacterium]
MKYLPLIWRNLGRNPLRSILTAAAIALAIALVCILRTMPAGLDAVLASAAANTRISTHNEAGIVYSMPYAYLQKVRAVPGVVAAISWNWFGGAIDISKGVEFPNFAVDPEGFAEVYADWGLDPKAFQDFRKYRDAALVGHLTLEKQRWKVGDVVTLQSTVFPVTLSFRIVGSVPTSTPSFYFQREYLAQALAAAGTQFDSTGMIWSRIDDPDRVAPVMNQIDEMFRNSEAITSTETEKSFVGNFFSGLKQLVTIIQIVAGLVTLCIVFIAANTASMSIRERVGEIAILKAIGFRKQTIFSTLLAEAGLLALVAGIAGAATAFVLTKMLQRYAAGAGPQMGPLTAFVVSDVILVQAIFIAFFIGILSGWVPALGASRRSVAQTLREVF